MSQNKRLNCINQLIQWHCKYQLKWGLGHRSCPKAPTAEPQFKQSETFVSGSANTRIKRQERSCATPEPRASAESDHRIQAPLHVSLIMAVILHGKTRKTYLSFCIHDSTLVLSVQITFSEGIKRKKAYLDIWMLRLQLSLLVIGINGEIFGQQFSVRKGEKEYWRNCMK